MASVQAMWRQESIEKTEPTISEPEAMRKRVRQVSKGSTIASDGDRSLSPATSLTRGVPSSAVLGDDCSCGGHYRSGGVRALAAAKAAAPPPASVPRGLPSSAVMGDDTSCGGYYRSGGHRAQDPAALAATPLASVPGGVSSAAVLGDDRSCGGYYCSGGTRAPAAVKPAATQPESMPAGVPSSAVMGDDTSCGGYYRSSVIRPTKGAAALPRAAAAPVIGIDGGINSAAATGPDTRGAWKWL